MLGIFSYKRPINLVVAVNLLAFGLLFYRNSSKEPDWKTIVAGVTLSVLVCVIYFLILKKNLGDEYLFLIVSMLTSIGFIMIFRLDPGTGFKQFGWLLAGGAFFLAAYYAFYRFKFWSRLMYLYILASLGLYVLTLGLGRSIGGAKNWIVLGSFRFQPSELIKVLFVLFLACYFTHRDSIKMPKLGIPFLNENGLRKLFLMAVVYMNIGFLFLQREWGTAVLLLFIFLFLVYVFEKGMAFFLVNSIIFIVCVAAGYFLVYHIKVRVDMWMNPWADVSGKGYQITQSLFALASGGFFGTGLGVGSPDLIPAVNTDFIFSAICEEMGIFGGMAVILLYFILAYRSFKIVLRVSDRFYKALALGITVLFGLQTFIIIGGVIKLIPLTGITLPFISYGGSSLITSFMLLGILQALSGKLNMGGEAEAIDGE